MTRFPAQWLALREPYDLAVRNPAVFAAVLAAFQGQTAVAVVDLACGTGATLRAISTRLPMQQTWRLVDNDLGLLAAAAASGRPPAINVIAQPVDLVRDLELALDGPIDLITTSALLDLVSSEWLERLVVEAAARRLPVYAALTYDGRITFEPADSYDDEIIAAVNRHQLGNKGFGPALGPHAAVRAIERFESVGYRIMQGRSDWMLEPDDRAMQAETLTGFANAVRELGLHPEARVAGWLERRRRAIEAGCSRTRVGHTDFFALPMPIR